MSIRMMTQVWGSNLAPEHKYVLLKMADHADDSGLHVFPSVHTIALHTGLSERTVQRRLRELRDMGLIEISRAAQGQRPTEYTIRGDRLTPLPVLTTDRGDRGDTPGVTDQDLGVTGVTQRGDSIGTLTVINRPLEPSINHQGDSQPELTSLEADLVERRQKQLRVLRGRP